MEITDLRSAEKEVLPKILVIGDISKKLIDSNDIKSLVHFSPVYLSSEESAFDLVLSPDIAAILLSYPTSGEYNFRALKYFRQSNRLMPMLLVSEKPLHQDIQVDAYDAGATDIVDLKTSEKISVRKICYFIDLHQAKLKQLDLQDGLAAAGTEIQKNEEKLQFALASAKMGTWTVSLPSGFVTLSNEARNLFGFSKVYDHSDAAIDDFIHPDFRQQARDVLANAIATDSFYNDEYQIVRPDGELRWINARGKVRYDNQGNAYELSGLIWDITDRKNAEIGLKNLEIRFQRSTEATDLGVWYCNLPFDELIWNNEVKGHFFLPPDANVTIGMFYEIIHPEDRKPTRDAIEESIASGNPYDVIYRTVDPNNSENIKYIRAIGWTDYNESGDPIRFDGITLDVSFQHAYEQDLRRSKEAAEKANELKSAFLANMSHEIRTPLGAMIGFADLLKDSSISDEERLSYANVITRNGTQLSHIINDILDISKVESGQISIEYLEVEPVTIAEEVMSLLSVTAKDKDIGLRLVVEDSVPKTFNTDPVRLRQILMNIIGNAIKFTKVGEVAVTVFSEVGLKDQSKLFFRVLDTGEGIAPGEEEKLFQVFSQGDNSITRKFGGTGLGLALSKKLAEALHGDVVLERSIKNEGSSFLISITEGTLSSSNHDYKNLRTEDAKHIRLKGVKILLVDDTADNQDLITKVLTDRKAIVDIAHDGREGVEKALHGNYDVVLMDLQMPVMDGYTATQYLRERGFDKPIVALSAHAMTEVRLECLNVGCTDYLTKPINFNDLIRVVGKCVGNLSSNTR